MEEMWLKNRIEWAWSPGPQEELDYKQMLKWKSLHELINTGEFIAH